MQKNPDTFLDHFARLGVFNMVNSLAGPPPEDEEEEDGDDRISEKKVSPVKNNYISKLVSAYLLHE